MARLGERVAAREAGRYVGREHELRFFSAFLDDHEASIVLLHGPGGIGKSALLRRVAAAAEADGWTVHWIDARQLPPVPDALEDALSGARDAERPLVVLDSYERVAALGGYLRRGALPSLPDSARVVIAGRVPPDAGWQEGGWPSLAVERRLEPLSDEEALELMRAHGIDGGGAAREIVRWAAGSPLALTLAASAAAGALDGEARLDRAEIVEPLIRRLADPGDHGTHGATLGTASIARQTTVALLRDVAPDLDAEGELEWLASRGFVESLGEGVAPHELVRKALRADLRRRDPLLERELRRRIADHFYRHALATGSMLWIIDLAELAENPIFRWGFSWEAAARYRVDNARADDAAEIAAALGERGLRRWAPDSFLREAPELLTVCRDAADRLCGLAAAVTPAAAPAFAAEDPVLGPRLEHARRRAEIGEAVVWRANIDLVGDPWLGVIGLLGMATLLRAASGNPRFAYLSIDAAFPGAREFAAAAGGEHLPELDAEIDGRRIECHVIDWGEGGLLAAQREFIYRELGLPPPPRPRERVPASFEVVRDVLRGFGDDRELAASELAHGSGRTERAASVRAMITAAAQRAFDRSPHDELLREVLRRGYLDPAPNHDLAADELHLSRSTYFRRLREATERIAEELAARRS